MQLDIQTTNNKRYEEADILKGIAIFFVLLGHAIIYYPINLHEVYWCKFLFEFVSSVHLSLFFLVSGFLYRPISNKGGVWQLYI